MMRTLGVGCVLVLMAVPVFGQVLRSQAVAPALDVDTPLNADNREDQKLRQSLLIGGLTVSAVGYAYFSFQFNQARKISEEAADAYRADVLLNGEQYIAEGVNFDDLESYQAWLTEYEDAVVTREWSARTGLLTLILALFTVLDSAVTGDDVPQAGQLQARPHVNFHHAPGRTDVLVGTTLRF